MASLSTSSAQGSSGLGNTALRGFGGFASGLDRDALIEQMSKGTQTKLTKARQETTKIEWKRDAFRELADKAIDFQDEFLSFASTNSIKNNDLYSSNIVDVRGDAQTAKFITASGSSSMTKNLKISAVTKLATAESVVSDVKGSVTAIKSGITADALAGMKTVKTSNLAGKSLEFGNYTTEGKFNQKASFSFPKSYKDDDGKTVEIDYSGDKEKLVEALNKAAKQQGVKLGENKDLKFKYNAGINPGEDFISIEGSSDYVIKKDSSALEALGYKAGAPGSTPTGTGSAAYGLSLDNFNTGTAAEHNFSKASVKESGFLDYLEDRKLSVSHGGKTREISILTKEQKEHIAASFPGTDAGSNQGRLDAVRDAMQKNIDKEFGSGKIKVDSSAGSLSFNSANGKDTVSIDSSDKLVRDNLGIEKGASNRVSLGSSIMSSLDKLGLEAFSGNKEALDEALSHLSINGKEIKGINSDSTISDMLSKINDAGAGVRASFMAGSGRFVLVHTETGSGRSIDLGDPSDPNNVADKIFGATVSGGGQINHGQDAEIVYNYGNGINEVMTSSSNTFNIDGMNITANGKFGVEFDQEGNAVTKADGSYNFDSSKELSFSSKANVDKATEGVKKFVEKFNELVSSVNSHVKTRKAKGYEPLTEEQKKQLNQTSIDNWEKKAKEGILYGESSIRNFSLSLENVINKLVTDLDKAGLSYRDLQEMGISMSSDVHDGGKLSFDEVKFRKAMETEPEKVEKIMSGHNGSKGLAKVVEDSITPYATRYASRNGGSYGELIKEAGSNRVTLSNTSSAIYQKLKENSEKIEKLKSLLGTEQNRYIKQFSQLETLLNKMNTQSGYLNSLHG